MTLKTLTYYLQKIGIQRIIIFGLNFDSYSKVYSLKFFGKINFIIHS